MADLRTALFRSLADDGGLFMPADIPVLDASFWKSAQDLTFPELAFQLANALLKDCIPPSVIRSICDEAFDFELPLIRLEDEVYALELFHGPSLAFKDFGARFMAGLMAYLIEDSANSQLGTSTVNILVATSGDTGGAVAMGFLGTPGVKVTILYPAGKVSYWQELQLTTMGRNITAIALDGTFDDCQALVKKAFQDQELMEKLWLSSANSINLFRLIPQSFYYAWIYAQLGNGLKGGRLVVSVPSGNFGNLCAGLLAQRMGCPISHFVASTNFNDVVPRYLEDGVYKPLPTVSTISNAMDVGSPSNWERISHLFGNDYESIKRQISGYSFSDEVTTLAIEQVYGLHQYLLEPHAAIGYLGLKTYQKSHLPCTGVFLGTAHPAKFTEVLPVELGLKVEIPNQLKQLERKTKKIEELPNDFDLLKSFLLEN